MKWEKGEWMEVEQLPILISVFFTNASSAGTRDRDQRLSGSPFQFQSLLLALRFNYQWHIMSIENTNMVEIDAAAVEAKLALMLVK